MAAVAPDIESILAHQITPALVLDRSLTIIAFNNGITRLRSGSCETTLHHSNSSLKGSNISDIDFNTLPNALKGAQTWSSLLDAAFDAASATNNNDDMRIVSAQPSFTPNSSYDSDEVWEDEARQQAVIETNVCIIRSASFSNDIESTPDSPTSRQIMARAMIHCFSTDAKGLFIVCFSRRPTVPVTEAQVAGVQADPTGESEDFARDQATTTSYLDRMHATGSKSQPLNDSDAVSTNTAIALSIIPHIVATFDTNGQAISLSSSWYTFSGLEIEQSLGEGWLSIMHPEDRHDLVIAWADVIRHERSHWTHQARFQKASDGAFCWFLIRAEPYRDETGTVLRWYASMMDIHEWVIARLKADLRRQSIITLFAQTDVMLWGIDKTNQMYICEGRLKWDPNRVVKLLEGALSDQTAQAEQATNQPTHDTDRELVHTIRGVLQGRTFSPIVEHWEDHRYFRTRFVAEHVPQGIDGSTTSQDVVQAALALTFDITEEKARSVLLSENKRLVAKEKAALDASNLKSRFLANVSKLG